MFLKNKTIEPSKESVFNEYKTVITLFDTLIEELETSLPQCWSPLQRRDVQVYFEKHLTNALIERGFYSDDDISSKN
jgi:hypothetical protein